MYWRPHEKPVLELETERILDHLGRVVMIVPAQWRVIAEPTQLVPHYRPPVRLLEEDGTPKPRPKMVLSR